MNLYIILIMKKFILEDYIYLVSDLHKLDVYMHMMVDVCIHMMSSPSGVTHIKSNFKHVTDANPKHITFHPFIMCVM
jgi:hypothetical protein